MDKSADNDRLRALMEAILIQCAPDEQGAYDYERTCWDVEQIARAGLNPAHVHVPYPGPNNPVKVTVRRTPWSFITEFSIGHQGFRLAQVGRTDDDAEEHCKFMQNMLVKALGFAGVRAEAVYIEDPDEAEDGTFVGQTRWNEDRTAKIKVLGVYGYGSGGALYSITFPNSEVTSCNGLSHADLAKAYPHVEE